jgi:hypothetical protein
MSAGLLVPRASHAQSASDKETARALMQDGDKKRATKDLRGALERYQAADALMHVATTGLEVARAQIDLGMLVEAREKLLEVVRIPPKPGDSPVLGEARATALALSDSLEPRIPGLRVALKGAPDTTKVTVEVDGISIPPAALIAFRKLNPGAHSVVARYGNATRKEDVTLKEGENRDLALDFTGEPAPSAGAAVVPAKGSMGTSEGGGADTSGGSQGPWKTLMLVGFGVGGAGIIAGSVSGILAFTKASAAKSVPASQGGCTGDNCGPGAASDINASRLDGTVSTVSFIFAGAGVALGVTSLVLAKNNAPKDSAPAPTTGARLVPWLGLGSAGVVGTF